MISFKPDFHPVDPFPTPSQPSHSNEASSHVREATPTWQETQGSLWPVAEEKLSPSGNSQPQRNQVLLAMLTEAEGGFMTHRICEVRSRF